MRKTSATLFIVLTTSAGVLLNSIPSQTAVAETYPRSIEQVVAEIVVDDPRYNIDDAELECLAKNIYFEAGIESDAGKVAVANVVFNRVDSSRYPDTICGVVQQGPVTSTGMPKRNSCQFSWWCDGKADVPYEGDVWERSQSIALRMYQDYNDGILLDITEGSMYYHATYVNPRWARSMNKTAEIDTHIFYN